MSEVIVADAGPLIALSLIDSIGLLARMHRRVVVPNAVRDECLRMPDKPGTARIQQAFACGWLDCCHVLEVKIRRWICLRDQPL